MTQKGLATYAPRLPYPAEAERMNVDSAAWRVLVEAIWPSAKSPASVLLALSYCKARKLDPLKRPIHIVPIWDSKQKKEVETIWPGIGELRTTASRTGGFGGNDDCAFGPDQKETFGPDKDKVEKTVVYPLWAQMTGYRIVDGVRCKFVGPKVYWKETYKTRKNISDVPNNMWGTRPRGQLEKCAEAAMLRRCYPEELGDLHVPEEIRGAGFETVSVVGDVEIQRPQATTAPQPSRGDRQTTPPASNIPNPFIGVVEDITEKKGGTGQKKWTLYIIKMESGQEFTTFDRGVVDALVKVGRRETVEVAWEPNEKDPKKQTATGAEAHDNTPPAGGGFSESSKNPGGKSLFENPPSE